MLKKHLAKGNFQVGETERGEIKLCKFNFYMSVYDNMVLTVSLFTDARFLIYKENRFYNRRKNLQSLIFQM